MKIRYEVSGNMQRGEMQRYINSKPLLTRDQAITEWLELRFRTWILNNIVNSLSDFDFEPNTQSPVSFDVTFHQQAHGQMFFATMGGIIIG
ncbi:hypothetical protein G6L37_11935 [Agrobacterium rubi]|uniref:hypothetical protein n=1 Tax=Agrobacterium rubi TaxID=28099 RepID=UPI001572054D|nr:hypothetical protein [Agrobacterium rubi]NTF06872.1 hypothetical protein [Agrobacterium rubi]NTF19114.1 hypothetical protein [Agrobacterium rubi]NTF26077.1 hypothetical protein [Agrobacterium rubi]